MWKTGPNHIKGEWTVFGDRALRTATGLDLSRGPDARGAQYDGDGSDRDESWRTIKAAPRRLRLPQAQTWNSTVHAWTGAYAKRGPLRWSTNVGLIPIVYPPRQKNEIETVLPGKRG